MGEIAVHAGRYADWIATHVPEECEGQCEVWTRLMVQAFPELRRQYGLAAQADIKPYELEFGKTLVGHWWCEEETGEIVDPTAKQLPWPIYYLTYDEQQGFTGEGIKQTRRDL